MSKTYKHQATYDYLHNNKEVKGKLLKGIKKFFMNVNFPRWDFSRRSWYKHKNRYDNETIYISWQVQKDRRMAVW